VPATPNIAVALLAVAIAGPAVAPPPAPGQWQRLGPVVNSRPGQGVHFFRTAVSPKSLGVVVTSSSARPIRVHWFSYCEFESDDYTTQENQQTLTGLHSVIAYPPVFDGATLCYVSVTASAGRGSISAAVFAQKST